MATADQRIELFNTGFIEPFKKPHQRYTGNLYFKSLAEGGSHVGGGGELFPYEVKMMSYLNSLDRLKNLPQAYRANIEDKLILLPIEMVKDFNSGIGQPTKLNWVRLNAETGTIQIDRSVVESIQTSIAARTELANTTSNFVLEILLQPSI